MLTIPESTRLSTFLLDLLRRASHTARYEGRTSARRSAPLPRFCTGELPFRWLPFPSQVALCLAFPVCGYAGLKLESVSGYPYPCYPYGRHTLATAPRSPAINSQLSSLHVCGVWPFGHPDPYDGVLDKFAAFPRDKARAKRLEITCYDHGMLRELFR